MIPLSLPAFAEGERSYVARLRTAANQSFNTCDAVAVRDEEPDATEGAAFAGPMGLFAVDGIAASALEGDVVLVDPAAGRMERLLRAGSAHNTLLVTERCDQLCVMCSQPPKKTHLDRFALLEQACLLAEAESTIGITGGEPTLYKEQLLGMLERVLSARPDISFHVLSNGQHFAAEDVARLRSPLFRRVVWGIPLYAADPALHDRIVGKAGAFSRLEESLSHLVLAGARIELRTVLLTLNSGALPALARHIAARLRFITVWSVMQLENIGFAKNRWPQLYHDHGSAFAAVAEAVDQALLRGIAVQLFNFPRCTVPASYRRLAAASISDWKRKYMPACNSCSQKPQCCGFFEWHADDHAAAQARPL